jgi:hypothetical protein
MFGPSRDDHINENEHEHGWLTAWPSYRGSLWQRVRTMFVGKAADTQRWFSADCLGPSGAFTRP